MPEVGRGTDAIADTDGDGAGKEPNESKVWKILRILLPDHLSRLNTPATGTRHKLWSARRTAMDKAVDVLEKTDGTIALHDRASGCLRDPTVRRSPRLPRRHQRLPAGREWQHNERSSRIH